MKSWWRKLAAAAGLVGASVAACGQNVTPAQMTGQPLQYMRDGALSGCGLRIIAVLVNDDLTSEASEVSVNLDDNGNAMLKAVAYAKFLPGKPMPRPVKVVAAWAKAPGAHATHALKPAIAGEDKLSLLYATDLTEALGVMRAQLDGTPVQISVQRSGQGNYRIMSGIVALTPAEQTQLRNCMQELIEGMQQKLTDSAASAPQ